MADYVVQVGAPDPERRTSPILDEYEEISLDMEIEAGVCYFNDTAYPIGTYVLSGSEMLHGEERGVWVRKGEMRPKKKPGDIAGSAGIRGQLTPTASAWTR